MTTLTEMVTMRDGVRLATNVILPEGAEQGEARFPTVLVRTPYDKDWLEATFGWSAHFARHGYVAITQDCRGCYASEGTVDFLWPEDEDGYDTAAWICEQPWSNGKIATHGTSWMGWTQTALAAAGAPGVSALVPTMSGSCAFTSSVRHGGAIELRFVAWAYWHSTRNTAAHRGRDWLRRAALAAPGVAERFTALPLRRGATGLESFAGYEDWMLEISQHDTFDGRWREPAVWPAGHMDTFSDAPMVVVGGWYDSYARGSAELFRAATDANTAPTYLIMGPWTHGTDKVELTTAGDVEFGRSAAIPSFVDLHRSFYDEFLVGKDEGWANRPKVRIFVMGGGSGRRTTAGRLDHGGHWRDEETWPLARAVTQTLHLAGDGSLAVEAPSADLPAATTFAFDPSHPVPTIGGNLSSLDTIAAPPDIFTTADTAAAGLARRPLVVAGGFDQRTTAAVYGATAPYLPLNTRRDVVTFQTAPLEQDLEVTGTVRVRLWVSTDGPDTDFTAKLIDVHPSSPDYPYGYALNLTDSIIRLRSVVSDYQPGEVVEIEIELYPTSNLFCAGHRIRIDISSSNFPRFDVNPNTGDPAWTERHRRVALNTIHHGGQWRSVVELPVVPSDPA